MTSEFAMEVSARIEHALEEFFSNRAHIADAYGKEYSELWAHTAKHARGGKLLRPRLFLEAVEAFNTTSPMREPVDSEAVEGLAAAIEVLHFAFLLHDDVIDGDLVRRHRPNLIGTIRDLHPEAPTPSSLHWGNSAAILMGDLLLSSAVISCARLPFPVVMQRRVLDLVDEAITETVAGEHLDVGLSNGAIATSLDAVVAMTTMKTATYSFALPLRLAGALSAAERSHDRALAKIGRDLGFAFQVQDDLLTMFGSHVAHGKDVLSDLREGKHTVLVSFLRTTAQWDDVSAAFGDPAIGSGDADRIRVAVEESGARDFAERMVAERLSEVVLTLQESSLPAPVCRVIADCMDRIEGRTL